MLQQKLSTKLSTDTKPLTDKKKHNIEALRVFRDTFGMGESVQSSHFNDDMDDAMDWEPIEDDPAYSFQQLESMVVDELTDSAYIVPDTNVFLDSLAIIKSISEQGMYLWNAS